MKINDLIKEAHENAKAKGWWDEERSPLEIYALIHSEVSEAVEEARKESPSIYKEDPEILWEWEYDYPAPPTKPEGELIELADVVIRIADYCGKMGWNLEEALRLKMDYNKTRSHRHGGKKY